MVEQVNMVNAHKVLRAYRMMRIKPLKTYTKTELFGTGGNIGAHGGPWAKYIHLMMGLGVVEEVKIKIYCGKHHKSAYWGKGYRLRSQK